MKTPSSPTRIVRSVLALLTISLLLSPSVHAAGTGEYGVGTTAREYADPERNTRPVPTDLYYPADQDGPGVPPADGLFPTVSFGHGFLIGADRYAYLAEGLARAGSSDGGIRIHLEAPGALPAIDDLLLMDVSGRIVGSRIVTSSRPEGVHWPATSLDVPSGVYWIVARSGNRIVGRGRLERIR